MRFAAHECLKLNLTLAGEVTASLNATGENESVRFAAEKIKQWNPDVVLINGFIGAPIPDFIRMCSERQVKPVFLATALSMHEGALKLLKSIPAGYVYMGVNPYRYWYMDGPVIEKLKNIRREKHRQTHPDQLFREEKDYQPNYYMLGAVQGMILIEAARKAYKLSGGKEPSFDQVVNGLRSIKDLSTGGLTDAPITIKNNSFDVGRLYRADPEKAVFIPVPHAGWGDFFLN